MLHLDHVMCAVNDLDEAGDLFLERYGLASIEGGEHVGIGTANRIVPLGESYIELIAIVDGTLAAANPLGIRLRSFLDQGEGPMIWCVATDDIRTRAKWIGDSPQSMTRRLPDGRELAWRLAGLGGALADRSLPFFIGWECAPEDHPGRERAPHECEPLGIDDLEISGDPKKIDNRVGGRHEPHDLPITVVRGEPGLLSVTIATTSGTVRISGGAERP